MTRIPRLCLALFMAFAVASTAHNAAAMRGMQGATGQMVICTGTGPVTVFVDENGQPTKPPHICPDCLIHVMDAVAAETGEGTPQWQGLPLRYVDKGSVIRATGPVRASARAPPVLA